jgi:hypothetical protein
MGEGGGEKHLPSEGRIQFQARYALTTNY